MRDFSDTVGTKSIINKLMDIKNLDEQIALVRHHSLGEFCQYIKDFVLKEKAVQALFEPRIEEGVRKFEAYVEEYGQLPLGVERALLETRREDLQEIYFAHCDCHKENEAIVVCNPRLYRLYYTNGRSPGDSAQLTLARSIPKTIWRFMKKFCFCSEALVVFNRSAPPEVRKHYYRLHPAIAG